MFTFWICPLVIRYLKTFQKHFEEIWMVIPSHNGDLKDDGIHQLISKIITTGISLSNESTLHCLKLRTRRFCKYFHWVSMSSISIVIGSKGDKRGKSFSWKREKKVKTNNQTSLTRGTLQSEGSGCYCAKPIENELKEFHNKKQVD